MSFTPYHAKYVAHDLTRRFPPGSNEKIAGAVASAQVDLNPHQVDAALFAFKSPLSKGVLLADEVGLGKTIEAGLVLSQQWAEGKRRILVITPSNLRKQWFQELTEKFFLPCRILEAKSYNASVRQGDTRPFWASDVVICSYQFARSKAYDIQRTPWDIVVIDEAHRLRNVYKPSNVIANTLKEALAGKYKLLLTATPLQNSLLELYGLVSFIDEHTFGDVKSFREQFANLGQEQVFQTLKARIAPICHRTLRRQVTAYIPYTKRLPLVEEFTPAESEDLPGAGRDIAIAGNPRCAAEPRLPAIRFLPRARYVGSYCDRVTNSPTRNGPIWCGCMRHARRPRSSQASSCSSPPCCVSMMWTGCTAGCGGRRRATSRRCRRSRRGCGATAMPWKRRWRRSGATDRSRVR